MANYANAKATIAANIYTNHLGQVTAEMVKTAANEIVNTLIAGGYLYAGIAHPGDAAVSPDANVFYIATEPGTYTNFVGAGGSLVVADGEVAIFKWNGTWSKEVTGIPIVSVSQNTITIGGIPVTPLTSNVIIGDNNTPILTNYKFIPGHTYILYIYNKDWDYTVDAQGTRWRFRIIHTESGVEKYADTVPSTQPQNMKDVYLIQPTNAWDDGSLQIGIRADEGEQITIYFVDFTIPESFKDERPIVDSNNFISSGGVALASNKKTIIGQNNTPILANFSCIIPNHTYILYIKNKDWSYTVDAQGTRWRFRVIHTEDSVEKYSYTVPSIHPEYMLDSYIIKPTNEWDDNSLVIGIRADEGEVVEYELIDITFIENNIFNLNKYKESAIENLGYYPTQNAQYGANPIPPLCFLHASDFHAESNRYDNMVRVLEHYSQLQFAILTGDLVELDFTSPFTTYENAVKNATKPVLFVLGNHDCGNPTDLSVSKSGTNLQCYNKYFADYIASWGVGHSGTNNYWYKDFPSNKVRVIGLYEFDTLFEIDSQDSSKLKYNRGYRSYSQEQIDWVIACLSPYDEYTNPNGLPDGYGVIIAEHQPEGTRQAGQNNFCSPINPVAWGWDAYYPNRQTLPIATIVEAFINKSAGTATITQTGGNVSSLTITVDFTNRDNSQEFICYLGGHQHNDYIGFLQGYPNQLQVQIASAYRDTKLQDMRRMDDDVTQDCLNLVSIDRNNKTVSIVRFGADTSMTMQDRKCISVSYIPNQT